MIATPLQDRRYGRRRPVPGPGRGFLVVLRTSWFREKVRERIVSEVEHATGGRAGIGSFRFDGGAMRAEVRDFVLHGTEEPGAPPLLRARRIAVWLKLTSLLRRDIDIQSLEIEVPELRIVVHPDGSTNLPHPRVPRPGTRNAVEQFLALAIGRVDVYGGTVECGIEKTGIDLHGEQLRARLFYEASPEKYRGDVSVRRASLKSRHVPAGPLDIAASVELEGGRLALRSASLRTAKSTVEFRRRGRQLASRRVWRRSSLVRSPWPNSPRAWSLPVAPPASRPFKARCATTSPAAGGRDRTFPPTDSPTSAPACASRGLP